VAIEQHELRTETSANGRGPAASPALTIGGPACSSWREQAFARIGEQRAMCAWLVAYGGRTEAVAAAFERAIGAHLQAAEDAAKSPARPRSALNGAPIDRIACNLDAVEADLLRLAPADYLQGQMPSAVAHVRRHLEPEDPRRKAVEDLAKRNPSTAWNGSEPESLITAVHAASSKARREVRQVRSFRNTLFATAFALSLAALAMFFVGLVSPASMPLCFTPESAVVCPTGESDPPVAKPGASEPTQAALHSTVAATASAWDIAVVELLGLIAGGLAAAIALRNVRGTTMPYSLPVALAILKLPTGALTAVLGLLLVRGEFIPGLSALDTSAQILSWAVVFGYAQQLLTQFVDRQAHTVLDSVRSGGTAPAQPAAPTASAT
jgi:chaperone required for assembly of F1-ATPase